MDRLEVPCKMIFVRYRLETLLHYNLSKSGPYELSFRESLVDSVIELLDKLLVMDISFEVFLQIGFDILQ